MGKGPFVRRASGGGRECMIGQWGLIGWFAKQPVPPKRVPMTNNARSETVATLPTFKGPWARGQRCLIPAVSYDEPNWEAGRNVWWRMRRRDGAMGACGPVERVDGPREW
jgi:putative SOS response-associated peptidase YedK